MMLLLGLMASPLVLASMGNLILPLSYTTKTVTITESSQLQKHTITLPGVLSPPTTKTFTVTESGEPQTHTVTVPGVSSPPTTKTITVTESGPLQTYTVTAPVRVPTILAESYYRSSPPKPSESAKSSPAAVDDGSVAWSWLKCAAQSHMTRDRKIWPEGFQKADCGTIWKDPTCAFNAMHRAECYRENEQRQEQWRDCFDKVLSSCLDRWTAMDEIWGEDGVPEGLEAKYLGHVRLTRCFNDPMCLQELAKAAEGEIDSVWTMHKRAVHEMDSAFIKQPYRELSLFDFAANWRSVEDWESGRSRLI